MSKKILFISQEIAPFVPETPMSVLGKEIPQTIFEFGYETRAFHPKWGNINERRNQLHEVQRLSGMNTIIDDTDHPLIIKVATLPSTKMQVYFIDNEDYFLKRLAACDREGVEYNDNYERAVFFGRSTLEITKKLRWHPSYVLCQGWISAVAPFLIKTVYKDEPAFCEAKVVTAINKLDITKPIPERFPHFLAFRNVDVDEIESYKMEFKNPRDIMKLALRFSDAAAIIEEDVDLELVSYAKQLGLPIIKIEPGNGRKEQTVKLTQLLESL
ncbi:MAG: glycogen/starch synthase [Prevotellaceae bacterium]|nr:glycogen/starch synthase [Prevotellaceae bacterium]